jgi:hypothetical protein
MSKLFNKAVDAVRALSPEVQDDVARAMLALIDDAHSIEPIDPAHLPAVLEGLAQAKRGDRATAEEIEAAFRRFDI